MSKVLGEGGVIQFQDIYLHNQNGQTYHCYRFPKRASHIKRSKQVWEALNPEPVRQRGDDGLPDGAGLLRFETGKGPVSDGGLDELGGVTCATQLDARGQRKTPQQEKAFAAETAAITGESKSQINRQLAMANALGDDLQRIQGTSLDKGVEMTALAKMAEPERKAVRYFNPSA